MLEQAIVNELTLLFSRNLRSRCISNGARVAKNTSVCEPRYAGLLQTH